MKISLTRRLSVRNFFAREVNLWTQCHIEMWLLWGDRLQDLDANLKLLEQ